eukprot:c31059_g1_i1 orf=169-363(+)
MFQSLHPYCPWLQGYRLLLERTSLPSEHAKAHPFSSICDLAAIHLSSHFPDRDRALVNKQGVPP